MEKTRQREREIIERFGLLTREQKHAALRGMLHCLRQRKPSADIEALVNAPVELPLGIFSQDKLSSLESIVKYLKEAKGMKLGRIARLLNRDNRTIWATYSNAVKKMPEPLSIKEGGAMPASLIADRALSVLEHIVLFLKQRSHSNHEIALLLHLDDRTIWSVYDNVKRKRGKQAE